VRTGGSVRLALSFAATVGDDAANTEDMDTTQLLVADVMTIGPIVVNVDASLEDADDLLASTYITGLPVVDRDGGLVGVITQADLVAYRLAHRTPQLNETGWAPRR
jgi:CBS domain-containing protein